MRSLQYFVGQSPWQAEPVIGIHQRLVGETLGEEDGVVLIDESSVVKQGSEAVGVARQYCGSVGKIANGQVGVYLGYASRKGYQTVEKVAGLSCRERSIAGFEGTVAREAVRYKHWLGRYSFNSRMKLVYFCSSHPVLGIPTLIYNCSSSPSHKM